MQVDTELVPIENPGGLNVILGQTHFIKTAEDVHEALVGSVPGIKFGVAFCEASGPCLVRVEGNDDGLKALAAKNALAVGAGEGRGDAEGACGAHRVPPQDRVQAGLTCVECSRS